MAEGFANRYGKDVMVALSAGLAPAGGVTQETVAVMRERNVDVQSHVPTVFDPREAAECDVVVNLSGIKLTGVPSRKLQEWKVQDPIGGSIELYRTIRDELEQRVMRLILELRLQATKQSVRK
jgi:protein-tyrosine-phosphatase